MWTVPAAINPHNISPMCQETALYTWKVTARRVGTYVRACRLRPACGLPDGGSPCCAATHSGVDLKLAAGNLPSSHSIEHRARELKKLQDTALGRRAPVFWKGSGNGSESQRCHLAQLCSVSGAQGTPKRYSS